MLLFWISPYCCIAMTNYTYTYACRNIFNTIKMSGHSSLEKYTSHFIYKGYYCVRGELETEQNCNILTPTLMTITAFLSHSPGLLNRGPGGPASLGHGSHSSIFSPSDLNSNCSIGGPEGPLCWVLVLSTASYLQLHLTRTSCAPSYIIVLHPLNLFPLLANGISNFRRLWNGMFDHHWAEITVMQFTGHPLPVHQFVTAPWDFNPVQYCQPSLPTQSLPMTGQRNMQLPPSLERHVWPGWRSIYNIILDLLCDPPGSSMDFFTVQWSLLSILSTSRVYSTFSKLYDNRIFLLHKSLLQPVILQWWFISPYIFGLKIYQLYSL